MSKKQSCKLTPEVIRRILSGQYYIEEKYIPKGSTKSGPYYYLRVRDGKSLRSFYLGKAPSVVRLPREKLLEILKSRLGE